jgi:predicted CxxxxCH...CXXCH cytochrome family protein
VARAGVVLLAAACSLVACHSQGDGATAPAASGATGSSVAALAPPGADAPPGSAPTCAKAMATFARLAGDTVAVGGAGSTAAAHDRLTADLNELQAEIPDAERTPAATYVTTLQRYADAIATLATTSAATDPTALARLAAAQQILSDPAFTAAEDALDTYFTRTCPP